MLIYVGMMAAPYVAAEAFGYFGKPNFGFWIIALHMFNSALGMARALVNPDWYVSRALAAGVVPDVKNLVITKVLSLAFGSLIAWHLGRAAGYF
jgi:hypothetical protein